MSSRTIHLPASFTRRSLLRGGLRSAVGVSLAASGLSSLSESVRAATPSASTAVPPVTVVPTVVPTLPPSVPSAWQAYHGVPGATHQAKFDSLSVQGYRMISISIYGDPNDPRYAAVWILRPGPAFIAMHGSTLGDTELQSNMIPQGYYPALYSVINDGTTDPRAACVFEQSAQADPNKDDPSKSLEIVSEGLFSEHMQFEQRLGWVPRSLSYYGAPAVVPFSPAYLATYQHMVAPWVSTMSPIDADTYQGMFNDLGSRGYRPVVLNVTNDHRYVVVFATGPNVGNWIGRHNLTADQYQQAFNDATAHGLIPLTVQAGGVGDDTRYAAVFAQLVP